MQEYGLRVVHIDDIPQGGFVGIWQISPTDKHQNGFAHANHPVRTMQGAITSRIDIRIGHFSKESIASSIISFVDCCLI
jgi:hypothetical protein